MAPLSALRRRAPVDVGDGGPPGSHSRGAPEEDTIGGAVAAARPLPARVRGALAVDAAEGRVYMTRGRARPNRGLIGHGRTAHE